MRYLLYLFNPYVDVCFFFIFLFVSFFIHVDPAGGIADVGYLVLRPVRLTCGERRLLSVFVNGVKLLLFFIFMHTLLRPLDSSFVVEHIRPPRFRFNLFRQRGNYVCQGGLLTVSGDMTETNI